MTKADDGSWDRYWAHGFLTSCADAFSGNYEGRMREVWEQQFQTLADQAHVLDICTGNGAIALIAAATARKLDRHWHIDAIDRASIYPQRAVAAEARPLLDSIHFHAHTDAAAMPFADKHFDLITGHFALEYTDTNRTVAELTRVCAPAGRIAFVIHHHDSIILRTTREEQKHIALLLEQTKLLQRAREFMSLVGAADAAQRRMLGSVPEAERRRAGLNDAAAAVSAAVGRSAHPEILRTALGYVSEAYRLLESNGLTDAMARLDTGEREIGANAGRLADLIAAAHDEAQIAALGDLFTAQGFEDLTIETLSDEDQRLIGWLLSARFNRG